MFLTAAILVGLGVLGGPNPASLPRLPRRPAADEERYLAAVYGELRAGASLRWALADAATSQDDPTLMATRRLALAGAPIAQLAETLQQLPANGRRIGAAIKVAAAAGGKSADIFLSLANRAAAQADLNRQQRTITTQARLSALVVGGLPLVWLAFGGVGRLRALAEAGAGAIAVVGAAMELSGMLLVWRLASR